MCLDNVPPAISSKPKIFIGPTIPDTLIVRDDFGHRHDFSGNDDFGGEIDDFGGLIDDFVPSTSTDASAFVPSVAGGNTVYPPTATMFPPPAKTSKIDPNHYSAGTGRGGDRDQFLCLIISPGVTVILTLQYTRLLYRFRAK